jgi:hypothetical protein
MHLCAADAAPRRKRGQAHLSTRTVMGRVRPGNLQGDRERAQCRVLVTVTGPASAPCDPLAPFTDRLPLPVVTYLARFKGISRDRTGSGLRWYLIWRAGRGLDPLAAQRPHPELCSRWKQQARRFRPPAVSRRFPVTAGLYRTCVIDGIPEHSPARQVRRPSVPAGSPAPRFTRLQPGARSPPPASPCDLALAAMPGLPGSRISEATGADTAGPGDAAATGCCACAARAPRSSWSRRRPRPAGPSAGQQASGTADRSCCTPAVPGRADTRPASPRRDGRHPDSQSASAHAAAHLRCDQFRRWR